MKTLNALNLTAAQSETPWAVDLVKITIDPTDPNKIIRLTNHYHDLFIADGTYTAAGEFLGFGNVSDELEIKGNSLDLSLSGVDSTFTETFLDNTVEGSLVEVLRGFYNEDTGDLWAEPEPRWSGRINNSSIQDDYNFVDEDKISISVSCKSLFETLFKKQNGRNTSLTGFQAIDSSDLSMEYVASIANFSPAFGKEEA